MRKALAVTAAAALGALLALTEASLIVACAAVALFVLVAVPLALGGEDRG